MTDETDSGLCHCGRPRLDHTLDESVACGISTPWRDEYTERLNLVCLRCGKKARDHSLNELLTSFGPPWGAINLLKYEHGIWRHLT